MPPQAALIATALLVLVTRPSYGVNLQVGCNHSCVLEEDGNAFCWGDIMYGQYPLRTRDGVAPRTKREAYALGSINAAAPIKSMSLGCYHTCLLYVNSTLHCFGLNEAGQLGSSNPESNEHMLTIPEAVSVQADSFYTCINKNDGSAECWGEGGAPRQAIGNQPSASPSRPPPSPAKTPSMTPTNGNLLSETPRVVKLAVGLRHACVIIFSGHVKCWGHNFGGTLGYNTTVSTVYEPKTMPFLGFPVPAVDIDAGSGHTCVVLVDGRMKCWGSNSRGQLGVGHMVSNVTAMDGTFVPLEGVQAVTLGSLHTCAMLSTFRAKCWGDNSYGQVGQQVGAAFASADDVPYIDTPEAITTIAAKYSHTCILERFGSVKCWGFNIDGPLGINSNFQLRVVPQNAIPLTQPATQISAGSATTCATLQDGSAICWGSGFMLGLGPRPNALIPTPHEILRFPVSVESISTGTRHTCVKLGPHGSVACWGSNSGSALGLGTRVTEQRFALQAQVFDLNATAVYAADEYTCVLQYDGKVICWGLNTQGRLGCGQALWSIPNAAEASPIVLGSPLLVLQA